MGIDPFIDLISISSIFFDSTCLKLADYGLSIKIVHSVYLEIYYLTQIFVLGKASGYKNQSLEPLNP